MFDVDALVADCRAAMAEAQPRLAVKEVLERAMRAPGEVAAALPVTKAELVPLHADDDLTVLKVIWAPGMTIWPHNHLMWAAIGLYGGQEDNTFYRRVDDAGAIVASGGKELVTGDVAVLGDDTIHAVTNPRSTYTAAIHVYGGNLITREGRSEWDGDPGAFVEVPVDFERSRVHFEAANTPN